MSRIGKKPVPIGKAKVSIAGQKVNVEGPKGKLELNVHPTIKCRESGRQLNRPAFSTTKSRAKGTARPEDPDFLRCWPI